MNPKPSKPYNANTQSLEHQALKFPSPTSEEIVTLSDRMLILWDPEYFERLWCCAEARRSRFRVVFVVGFRLRADLKGAARIQFPVSPSVDSLDGAAFVGLFAHLLGSCLVFHKTASCSFKGGSSPCLACASASLKLQPRCALPVLRTTLYTLRNPGDGMPTNSISS